jgi:hypothetical protein
MASQFGLKTEMMLFADENKRMLSLMLLPVAEVLGKIKDLNRTTANLKKIGITITDNNMLPPDPKLALPALPESLKDIDLKTYETYEVASTSKTPAPSIKKPDNWDTNKTDYEKYRTDKTNAIKAYSTAKMYVNQMAREGELLQFYSNRMTTYAFEQNYASALTAVYQVMSLVTDDGTASHPLLPADTNNQKLETAYRAKIVADVKGNNIIKTKLNSIIPVGQAPKSDLEKFVHNSQIYNAVNATSPEIEVNTLSYLLDIQVFVVVSHSIIHSSLGIAALSASNSTLNSTLAALKNAIIQYKAAETLADINTGETNLQNAYKTLIATVDLNIVTFEKIPENTKMYLSSPVTIKGKDIKKTFNITEGVASDMLSLDITLNQFEFDFDTKAMAVEVTTTPNKDFILNKYPDIFTLSYVKVKYISSGTTTT